MKTIEATEHSLFRYGHRVKKELLINQQGYKALAKREPNKIKEWREEIQLLLDDSIFIIQAVFDDKNHQCNFRLHKESRFILVLNSNSEKLITLFEVDYGFGDKINKITMNAILKEMEKLKLAKEKYIDKNIPTFNSKKRAISAFEEDISALKAKIDMIESQKKAIEDELNLYEKTIDVMTNDITMKAHNICHSIGYRAKEEF